MTINELQYLFQLPYPTIKSIRNTIKKKLKIKKKKSKEQITVDPRISGPRSSDYPDTKLNLIRAGAIRKTPCAHAQYLQKQLHRAIELRGEMAESSSSTVALSSGVQKRKRKVLSIDTKLESLSKGVSQAKLAE